ncbi:DUF6992 family protein [Adhaeribacter rhizoryzae]|nr:hypothetical protein [Adhaeribacter rhizoryzae]
MTIFFFCTSNLKPLLLQACPLLQAIILLGLSYSNKAQPEASLNFDRRMKQLKTGYATVLAIWAGLNLVTGGILMFIATEDQLSYFSAMNSSWGVVNLGVAWFLYSHHNEVFNQSQTILQQMDHQRHAEKMILFSIGLNLAFIASGFALQLLGHT